MRESGRSEQTYILTYSRLKTAKFEQLRILNREDRNKRGDTKLPASSSENLQIVLYCLIKPKERKKKKRKEKRRTLISTSAVPHQAFKKKKEKKGKK